MLKENSGYVIYRADLYVVAEKPYYQWYFKLLVLQVYALYTLYTLDISLSECYVS